MRNARTHPTPPTGLLGVGCSGARSRCSSPSPPTLPRLRPRVMPSLRPPPRSPLKRGKAHRCATGPFVARMRARVALRASVALRPPQRWNGLPTRMSARRIIGEPRRARGSRLAHRSLRDLRNGGTVCLKMRMSARLVLCRTRRAWGSRCAQRSLCDLRRGGRRGVPADAHRCATSHLSNASRPGVALRASVAMRHPGGCLKNLLGLFGLRRARAGTRGTALGGA